jgi:hypothetical protein
LAKEKTGLLSIYCIQMRSVSVETIEFTGFLGLFSFVNDRACCLCRRRRGILRFVERFDVGGRSDRWLRRRCRLSRRTRTLWPFDRGNELGLSRRRIKFSPDYLGRRRCCWPGGRLSRRRCCWPGGRLSRRLGHCCASFHRRERSVVLSKDPKAYELGADFCSLTVNALAPRWAKLSSRSMSTWLEPGLARLTAINLTLNVSTIGRCLPTVGLASSF